MVQQPQPKQKTSKADRVRLAGKVLWYLGASTTAYFVYIVLKAMNLEWYITWSIAIPLALAVQYVLTMIETALFSGELPSPWALNWSEGGPLPWIMIGALLALLLDVLFNIGGVSYFLLKLNQTDIGQEALGMSSSTVRIISIFVTMFFSVFLALGPELLDEFASFLETGQRKQPVKPPMPPQVQQQQPDVRIGDVKK